LVTPLPLPLSCPRATICAVELALTDGSRAAIISCYLPQDSEEHAAVCAELTQLPGTLPHPLIIMGGGSSRRMEHIVPERCTHQCTTISKMERTHAPHLCTASTALAGIVPRPPYFMGPQRSLSTNGRRGHASNSLP
jgi:hypothetical protein